MSSTNLEAKQKLLSWAQETTVGYKGVQVTNFTKSWQDGLAFCALVHHYRPDLIDFDSLKPENGKENMDLAFTALQKIGVPPLLDSEDIVFLPDEKCIRTYLMSVQSGLRSAKIIPPKFQPKSTQLGRVQSLQNPTSTQQATEPSSQNPKKPKNELTGLFSLATQVSRDENPDIIYKVIMIGDSSVGKSALFERWRCDRFLETTATIGVEFGAKLYDCNGKIVQIQLWDTGATSVSY